MKQFYPKFILVLLAATLSGIVFSTKETENETQSILNYFELILSRQAGPTGKVEASDVYQVEQQIQNLSSSQNKTNGSTLIWNELGPDNVGGRTLGILADNQHNGWIYAGAASGGAESVGEGNCRHTFKHRRSSIAEDVQCAACCSGLRVEEDRVILGVNVDRKEQFVRAGAEGEPPAVGGGDAAAANGALLRHGSSLGVHNQETNVLGDAVEPQSIKLSSAGAIIRSHQCFVGI